MNDTPLLPQLGATPAQIAPLAYTAVRHVVSFLMRWQAFDEALALLDAWDQGEMLSALDLRAQALIGAGRGADAVHVMRRRLAQKEKSVTALVLLGRALLGAGQTIEAGRHAAELTRTNPDYGPSWGLLGDTYLAAGYVDRAEQAFSRYRQLSPSARPPDIGLARVAIERGDVVAADAFAVRAIEEEGVDGGPAAEILRSAALIFAAVPDEVRLAEVQARLPQRFAVELEAAQAVLADNAARPPTQRTPAASTAPAEEAAPRPARAERARADTPRAEPPPPLSRVDDAPVSADEVARLTAAVRRLFGFPGLLAWQPQILAAVCRNEDVLAILPTGGGKSLCYQLPAFMDDALEGGAITLVVSPLIALMKDQLDNLPAPLRAATIAINSSMEANAAAQALSEIAAGRYKLVYVAPERLRQWPFLDALRARGVARLVVDEAHCVSAWGHNFRPDYLFLARAHRDLGAPPILALTATAPTRVRQDIEQQLFGRGAPDAHVRRFRIIAADSFRSNLHLNAFKAASDDERRDWLLSFCATLQGSGIVYARARRTCEELATLLQGVGVAADAYHAGLADSERSRIQAAFMAGKTRVLVATVAFGMGVDKPDIRFILHHGLPSSLEGYYQEAGRAGRDGAPARCVLLYTARDKTTLTTLARQSAIKVDFLRAVYREVRARLRRYNPGALATDEIQRVVDPEERNDTRVRVALSILEHAGLLRRHYDAPRSVRVDLLRPPTDPALADFAQRTGLNFGSTLNADYLELCARAAADATTLERDLLAWQRAGHLRVLSSGRDALITLVAQPPADAEARIAALIDRFTAVAEQQGSEIAAYARATTCRHGYLAAYLGGAARRRCTACDNCNTGDLPPLETVLPDSDAQRLEVLRTVQARTFGISKLTKVLAGDESVDDAYKAMPTYGALRFRSQSGIQRLVEEMVSDGLLARKPFGDGGFTFHLTANGTRALRAERIA